LEAALAGTATTIWWSFSTTGFQTKEAARWLARADEDAVVAELALTRDPPPINPAEFHCQQATEKMLKALLVAAGAAFPRSHDMELLIEAAAPQYPALRKEMQVFARLTEWLTARRYPDLGGGLGETPADVAEMLALIKAFGANVRALAPFRL
jgi:HEPN domain-containing protein